MDKKMIVDAITDRHGGNSVLVNFPEGACCKFDCGSDTALADKLAEFCQVYVDYYLEYGGIIFPPTAGKFIKVENINSRVIYKVVDCPNKDFAKKFQFFLACLSNTIDELVGIFDDKPKAEKKKKKNPKGKFYIG